MAKFSSYSEAKILFESAFKEYIPRGSVLSEKLLYATSDGGKRVRPVLMLLCGDAFGIDVSCVMPYAVALELVHSYSLVHDDMPEMDNDLIRRGKAAVHAKFGSGRALLTGDMLLSLAFDVASKGCEPKAMTRLTKAAMDMVEGQTLELELAEKGKFTTENIMEIYRLKTAALFKSAIMVPYELASCNKVYLEFSKGEAEKVGEDIGYIFQIVDDFLDYTTGEDKDKPTLINLNGTKHTQDILNAINKRVMGFFEKYNLSNTVFAQFVLSLTTRKS